MEPTTIELIREIATDAIKILGPAIITGYVAFRTLKGQYVIERLRLHAKDKVEAHKKLFLFARKMRNEFFPLAEDKQTKFISLMKSEYFGKVDVDSVYFSNKITNILDKLESMYICFTRGELIPEINSTDRQDFIENQLFKHAEWLLKYVREAMKNLERESGLI